MKNKFWLVLGVIIIFGGMLRLIGLDKIPPHLGNDEISIAYDSYSVRMIGKDEHGQAWPLSFRSHDDFKAPLYAYLNMPFNYLLGNTEYGVRTLSAVAGIISILLVGVIGRYIGGGGVGLVAAILLATNPKAIFASRIGFESNLASMLVLLGFWMILRFYRYRRNLSLILTGVCFGLSVWAYHTERLMIPIFAVILPWFSRTAIPLKKWLLMWIALIIVVAPVTLDFFKVMTMSNNTRASTQIWFKGPGAEEILKDPNVSLIKKSAIFITGPIYNYIVHFSLNINFTNAQSLLNSREPLDPGWYLLGTLPILIIGLIKGRSVFTKWWKWLLLVWLVTPIVPALTFGEVASVRNLFFIYPTILIMAGGMVALSGNFKKIAGVVWLLILVSFLMFCSAYYVQYPVVSGTNFQYGYKQAWEFIKPNADKYDRVVVENRFGEFGQFVGVPHLYFGYFQAFSPEEMQYRVDKDGTTIGKYTFKYIDWNKEVYTPKTIYVVSAINPKAGEFYDKVKEVGLIRNTDFKPQFIIYETMDIND